MIKGGYMRTYPGLRRRVCSSGTVFVSGLLVALLSMGLVACGNELAGNSSTQSQAQVSKASSAVQPRAGGRQEPVQPQVQKCGFVQGYGALKTVPIDTGSAEQAENCFWQAFQSCHPAMLIFVTSSLHATFTHTFSIRNDNGQCSIQDSTSSGSNTSPASPSTTYTCSGVKRYPRALYFLACGKDGTIVVLGF